MKNFAKIFSPLLLALLLSSCLGDAVKTLGENQFSLNPTNTATSSSFSFKFAYYNSLLAVPNNLSVFLQGIDNSSSVMIDTCNLSGSSCQCVFQNSSGAQIGITTNATISYDSAGNYLRCTATSAVLNATYQVVVKNISGTVSTNPIPVVTALTASDILGTLAAGSLRTMYKYTCNIYYLQKTGTTSGNFDCSDQGSNDLSLLVAPYSFYLYGDNNSNNFSTKPADQLYSPGTGGVLCGMQIKQLDCTANVNYANGKSGVPVKDFGIYAQNTGIFTIPVLLGPAPNQNSTLYGYAAATSTYTLNGTTYTICPPGFVPKIFYQSTPNPANFSPANNMPSNVADTVVSDPSITPATFDISRYTGGDCNGSTCTAPTTGPSTILTYAYSSAGQTTFCVLPNTILP